MTRTIEIAGRTYAAGFWWLMRSGGPVGRRSMLKLARETAAEFGSYNCAALRAEQYGLGRRDGPWPPKTVSLAAALRFQGGKHEAFLGVFCLEKSLWWVCGIRRDQIMPDGDAVFDSREKALAAAHDVRLGLEHVELTEIFQETPEAGRGWLEPLLRPETPVTALQRTERDQRRVRLGLIGGLAALAIICGLYWVYDAGQATRKTRQSERQLAEKEARKRDMLARPERYFRAEWLTAPRVSAAGRQCAEAFLTLPLSVNAWFFQEAVCRPGDRLQVSRAHTRGASFVDLPVGANLASPREVTGSRPLAALPSRPASSRPLLTRDQATAVLYELDQHLSGRLILQWDPPESHQIDEETTVNAPWRRGRFTLDHVPVAALLTTDLFGALSYPGAMLASLTRKNDVLTLEGYIYAATQ